jgi:hypothetical protein
VVGYHTASADGAQKKEVTCSRSGSSVLWYADVSESAYCTVPGSLYVVSLADLVADAAMG